MSNDQNPYAAPVSMEAPIAESTFNDHLATRGSRFVAKIIDGIVTSVVTIPLMFMTGYFARAMGQQVGILEVIAYSLVGIIIYYLIHGYLLATKGQTVGKLVMGIRIEDAATGQLIPMGKMVGLRDLPIMLVSMIPYIGGLISLVDGGLIFRQNQRCLHDDLATTRVVKVS